MRTYKGVVRDDGMRVVYETLPGGVTMLAVPFRQPGTGPAGQGMDWGRVNEGAVWLGRVMLKDCLRLSVVPEGLLVVFVAEVIAKLRAAGFQLTSDAIEAWHADLAGSHGSALDRRAEA